MLVYLPLEPYKERYTILLSSKNGWFESKLKKYKIKFMRVEGESLGKDIRNGQVLDCYNRSYYSLTQIAKVVKLIKSGKIKDGDILYLDDFWTPGIEAIPYICSQLGISIKIYAMLHAQSVDKYDFTYKMKNWMRHYEIGQSNYMSGVFCTSEYLIDLCTEAGLKNVFFGGLPYNLQELLKFAPRNVSAKKNQIIYTSRLDSEKNPMLVLRIAEMLKSRYEFVITTSAKELRSNRPIIVKEFKAAEKKGIITIKTGLTKKQYYNELMKSKYQLNTAYQDWLSWTLLESLTYHCIPIYPKYRSFPEYLPAEYLYEPRSAESAAEVIDRHSIFDKELLKIPEYYDKSVERYLQLMGLI